MVYDPKIVEIDMRDYSEQQRVLREYRRLTEITAMTNEPECPWRSNEIPMSNLTPEDRRSLDKIF